MAKNLINMQLKYYYPTIQDTFNNLIWMGFLYTIRKIKNLYFHWYILAATAKIIFSYSFPHPDAAEKGKKLIIENLICSLIHLTYYSVNINKIIYKNDKSGIYLFYIRLS